MQGPLSLLKSRKFALMVIGMLVVLLNKKLGLDLSTAEVGAVILPIVAAILGIAWEDTVATKAVTDDKRLEHDKRLTPSAYEEDPEAYKVRLT